MREVREMSPLADEKQAAQAYLYGYPLVYDLDEVEGFVTGHSSLPVGGPFNQFVHARDLLGPETAFVSPNNDTLYTIAMCDVREGPLVLHVPDTNGRYYVLQFVDAWTNNFAYVGRRATGTKEAQFLLTTGPAEAAPDGAQVITVPTGVFSIVGRVQVDGKADLDAVHALQDQFTLTAVGSEAGAIAGVPGPDPKVGKGLEWWEKFRTRLAAFPPPPADAPFLAICEQIGLAAVTSPYVDPDPELATLLGDAQKAGEQLIDQLLQGGGQLRNGWRDAAHIFDYNLDFFEVGTINRSEWKISDRLTAYATRAVAARAGLWGNHGYEADYQWTTVDADGNDLSGAQAYELRLDTPPPVDAFWSLTMYDVPNFHLVANPIDRYSIGDRTPGLVTADDGSTTIFMQHDAPGGTRDANWLPTPKGKFRPLLRLYQPTGDYETPAITRVA